MRRGALGSQKPSEEVDPQSLLPAQYSAAKKKLTIGDHFSVESSDYNGNFLLQIPKAYAETNVINPRMALFDEKENLYTLTLEEAVRKMRKQILKNALRISKVGDALMFLELPFTIDTFQEHP